MNRNNWADWQNHLREVQAKEDRLQGEIDSLRELFLWMESWTTLHWQVQILYVVSGYQVTLERDGNEEYGPFEGRTLRSALSLAKQTVGALK